jgi:hypothetical protein
MVILHILNNILLSLITALFVSFIYSYLFYKTLPLVTDFPSVFGESIKIVFLPISLITFLSLIISPWILLFIPIGIILYFTIRKVQSIKQKEKFRKIEQEKFIPVIEEWISKQKAMRIKDYHIYLKLNKDNLQATIYVYIESGLDRGQIRLLEEKLPPNTVLRIENFQKKTIITNSYNLAEE